MLGYILRRMLLAFATIVGVSVIVFVAARASGDVALLLMPPDATEAQLAAFRAEHGLDRSYIEQYLVFASDILAGNFGMSLRYQRPALGVLLNRLPATYELALTAFALALVIGVSFGIAAAWWRGRLADTILRVFAIISQSTPSFWIGTMAILVFAVRLGWLPTSGRSGPQSLVLPALTLMLFPLAAIMRITRSSVLEALGSEYVKFLRIKGVPERLILWKHALRNALIPVIALGGIQLGILIGGAVITETLFNWPGVGSLMVEAFVGRDYPIIQVGVLLSSTFLILLNLAIDIAFCVVDPRIRQA